MSLYELWAQHEHHGGCQGLADLSRSRHLLVKLLVELPFPYSDSAAKRFLVFGVTWLKVEGSGFPLHQE